MNALKHEISDSEQYVGLSGLVTPTDEAEFQHEFKGHCIGVRNGFLQIEDQDGDVFDVDVSQFSPEDL